MSADPDDPRAWMVERNLDLCARRFPARYTDAAADVPEVLAWAERYRADPRRSPSLLLLGPTGVGKTHQAYGALREAVARPASIRWEAVTAADLIAETRGASNVGDVLRPYIEADLLLLDDLGVAKASEWTEEVTYRVIDHRYRECRCGIFTSNVAAPRLRELLGERVASRLVEMCVAPVILRGADRRLGRAS